MIPTVWFVIGLVLGALSFNSYSESVAKIVKDQADKLDAFTRGYIKIKDYIFLVYDGTATLFVGLTFLSSLISFCVGAFFLISAFT